MLAPQSTVSWVAVRDRQHRRCDAGMALIWPLVPGRNEDWAACYRDHAVEHGSLSDWLIQCEEVQIEHQGSKYSVKQDARAAAGTSRRLRDVCHTNDWRADD